MSTTSSFYLARATDCAREARATDLANVRERCLRSEAVWRAMAERVLRTEASRCRRDAEKMAADAVAD
ncbi:hypothetical protein ACMT1E_04995 [Sphingomonas flavalba]|uniref:hypothetical protein n=1 Tax=Sphingomonas flavalba TaxID=2559804 RepID=UPI0039E0C5A1